MLPCCRWSMVLLTVIGSGLIGLAVAWLPSLPVKSELALPAVVDLTRGGGKQDWTMFGGSPSRNLVNTLAKKVPASWDIAEGKEKNIKWQAVIGNRGYGQPVIANGKIYIATNNAQPRDPKVKEPRAVLMCFNEADGRFLWQVTHEMSPPKVLYQAKEDGLCSTPTVDGNRLYYMAPAAQLICAEADTGKEVWKRDLLKDYKVFPHELSGGSPLVMGDLVFAVTGNGTDASNGKLLAPMAPSFIAVNKKDGTLKWSSNLPGQNIIEGQWGNPAWAEVKGTPQVIFPGGDCYLYSFEPKTGKLLWKFFCNSPKEAAAAKKLDKESNYLVATPVIHDNKLFIGAGMYPEHHSGVKIGHFWCLDLVKALENAGKNKDLDVSPVGDNFDPQDPANKNSALAWHYGGNLTPKPKFGRTVLFGRTASTAAVQDGLVYITEDAGYLHCLDAVTGKKYWDLDLLAGIWGSPYWVDNKVYVGNENGELLIFEHGKKMNKLALIDMETAIQAPPTVANGTLYVLTKTRLYAIGEK